MTFAATTNVSVEKSKAEIERTLQRYGADQFLSGFEEGRAFVAFRCKGKHVRFVLELPKAGDKKYQYTPRHRNRRSDKAAFEAWEQDCRSRWRALLLVVKAKLEAIASGIATFEDEFLAYIVMPNGQTVGEWVNPQLALVYDQGKMPPLLPDLRNESLKNSP